MFSSKVVPCILAMAKLVILLLSPVSQQQHLLVLWGHYSSLQKCNTLQMHLCSFSTFKTRGGFLCVVFFSFNYPFLFLSISSAVKSWWHTRRSHCNCLCHQKLRFASSRRTPEDRILQTSSASCNSDLHVAAFLAEWNKQCQRFSSVYMHSLADKNFDSPLMFALQTFHSWILLTRYSVDKEFQTCLHRWRLNFKFGHVSIHNRKLKHLKNWGGSDN